MLEQTDGGIAIGEPSSANGDVSDEKLCYVGNVYTYRKNPDISPLFEMGLTRCARVSALRVSVAAIERRLIRRLGG